jgi:hypothetical protein
MYSFAKKKRRSVDESSPPVKCMRLNYYHDVCITTTTTTSILVGATIILQRYCLRLDDSSEEFREQLPTYIAIFNFTLQFSHCFICYFKLQYIMKLLYLINSPFLIFPYFFHFGRCYYNFTKVLSRSG